MNKKLHNIKGDTKMNKPSIGILAIAIILFSIIAFVPQQVPDLGIKYTASIIWKDSDGNIKGDYLYTFYNDGNIYLHNLVTDNGLDFVTTQLTNPSATDIAKYIQFSTDTSPIASDAQIPATQITGNGLDRVAGAVSDTGTGTVEIYKLFTLSGTQSGIGSVWLCYKSSNTNPDTFCGIAIDPVINAISGDTIEVTITIEVENA